MPNYIVSYDLNGPHPTHAQMDEHLRATGSQNGRLLETVWYVAYSGTLQQLFDHLWSKLGSEDRLLVVLANEAAMQNLLVTNKSLIDAWNRNR